MVQEQDPSELVDDVVVEDVGAEILPDIPRFFDGVELVSEVWEPGDQPGYRRVFAKCPVHDNCDVRRNVGIRTTRHYRNKEVTGFIGAWLQRAGDMPPARHKAFKPELDVIREWLMLPDLIGEDE